MPLPEIEEIISKFKQQEERIDCLLQKKESEHRELQEKIIDTKNKINLSLEEARERNKNILKDLETVKGNLRSKAIFSPTEMQWEQICNKYQEEPSLPVITWRCHLPVFV